MARKSQRKTKKSDKLRLRLDTLNAILGIALMAFVLLGTLPLVSRASAKTKITENTLRSDEQPEKDGTDLSDENVPLDDSGTETGDSLDSEAAKDEVFTRQEHIEESKIAIAEKMVPAVRRNLAEYIDLQGVVQRWAVNTPGQVAVEIYDVNYGRVAASYNAAATMKPKSLYKLFYAYDGYTQISAGAEDPNQPYSGESTLGWCLDAMIRNSNNPCAEAMIDDPVRAGRVATLVQNLGLAQTASNGLMSSAHDISRLLQHYLTHPGWSGESWAKFLNSALNQPINLRKGLPSGIRLATVYNKTGFGPYESGYVYNDAAIVDFAGERRYIMVAMTSGAGVKSLANLGSALERAIVYQ